MHDQPGAVPGQRGREYESMKALSLTQRLNRLRYCCYTLTGQTIVTLVAVLLYIFTRATWMPEAGQVLLWSVIVGVWLAALIWFIGLFVRRLHDTDRSGLWVLLIFVPLLNLLLILYLLLAPGTAGANRFGMENPPNGVLVMVFGGLWWLVQILTIAFPLIFMGVSMLMPGEAQDWMKQMQQMQGSMLNR